MPYDKYFHIRTYTFADVLQSRCFKNFSKFTKKLLCWSLFLILSQISILQHYWKKRLRYKCFLMNFARYIQCIFCRTPPVNCFCSTEKKITTKIVKSPLEKENKLGTACKKNNDTSWKKKLKHYLHQVFISWFIC